MGRQVMLNQNGTAREAQNLYYNLNGTLKTISTAYYNDNGTLKQFWPPKPPSIIEYTGIMIREYITHGGKNYVLYHFITSGELTTNRVFDCILVGGGGGGGAAYYNGRWSGGGGAGGEISRIYSLGSEDYGAIQTYEITIGAGGVGAASNSHATGSSGGTTTLKYGSTTLSAIGGAGTSYQNGASVSSSALTGSGGGAGAYNIYGTSSYNYTSGSAGTGKTNANVNFYPFYSKIGRKLGYHCAGGSGGSALLYGHTNASGYLYRSMCGGDGGSAGSNGRTAVCDTVNPAQSGIAYVSSSTNHRSQPNEAIRGGGIGGSTWAGPSNSYDTTDIDGHNAGFYGGGGGGGAIVLITSESSVTNNFVGKGGDGYQGIVYLLKEEDPE